MSTDKIKCKVIIQMAGTPKDHLQKTLKAYIDKLKIEYKKDLEIIDEYYAKPEKEKKTDKHYNTFCELEIDFFGAENITWFCIDYLPASIEVISPDEIIYSAPDFTDYLNDMLSKLHKIDMQLKGLSAQNELLNQNGMVLAKNLLTIILSKGNADIEKISKLAGMPSQNAEKFLDLLIKEGKIKKDKDIYRLA